jgi:hypothetical protein
MFSISPETVLFQQLVYPLVDSESHPDFSKESKFAQTLNPGYYPPKESSLR